VQRVIEACAEIVGCPPERSPQVWTADVSDKQSVSGEDGARVFGVLLEVEDQDRDGLDSVAGSLEDLQA
jgi:hypothetical protein